jgi:hypothetical protein
MKKSIDKVKIWAELLDLVDGDDEISDLPYILDDSLPIEVLGIPKSRGF